MGLDVMIRPAREDEHALIYSAWINTQHQSRVRKLMSPRVHDMGLHRLIARTLARPSVAVRVAEFEGVVAAFAVVEGDVVHYVFVKEPYRRQGLARTLLRGPDVPVARYTHKPEEHRNIPIPASWVYDPFAAWAPE